MKSLARSAQEDRFLSHVDTTGDCWLWTASLTRKGYAALGPSWGTRYGHRWAYINWVGPIPEGLEIDHLCNQRRCVNPSHLEAVTHAENLRRARPQAIAAAARRSAAHRAANTRCPQGHAFTTENTYYHPTRGLRICRTCHKASAKAWRERNRAAS